MSHTFEKVFEKYIFRSVLSVRQFFAVIFVNKRPKDTKYLREVCLVQSRLNGSQLLLMLRVRGIARYNVVSFLAHNGDPSGIQSNVCVCMCVDVYVYVYVYVVVVTQCATARTCDATASRPSGSQLVGRCESARVRSEFSQYTRDASQFRLPPSQN